jgi:hypothetical protein
MTRIFTTLAWITGLALVLSFGLGVASWWRGAAQQANDALYLIHFTVGLFTAIGILLVHCIIFTYFLGTGRWVKEVKQAYHLPDEPLPLLTRELKRQTFPPALAAMLITIATAAAGAGVQLQEWPWTIHGALATLTLMINLWAFRIEYRNVRINGGVIEDVMREVDRIRAERGLPRNDEALQE